MPPSLARETQQGQGCCNCGSGKEVGESVLEGRFLSWKNETGAPQARKGGRRRKGEMRQQGGTHITLYERLSVCMESGGQPGHGGGAGLPCEWPVGLRCRGVTEELLVELRKLSQGLQSWRSSRKISGG